jgi:hypothetical protein
MNEEASKMQWVKYEASASMYQFAMVHLDNNETVLIDHKGAWSAKVRTYDLKTGRNNLEYTKKVIEQVIANPTFGWSSLDAKNIVDGALEALYTRTHTR